MTKDAFWFRHETEYEILTMSELWGPLKCWVCDGESFSLIVTREEKEQYDFQYIFNNNLGTSVCLDCIRMSEEWFRHDSNRR